jgi:hypothetical protein
MVNTLLRSLIIRFSIIADMSLSGSISFEFKAMLRAII